MEHPIRKPGSFLKLPLEVALHVMGSRSTTCDQQLDKFDQTEHIILVMEHLIRKRGSFLKLPLEVALHVMVSRSTACDQQLD
ncbi:hypothetical protein DPEC_G00224760 [Dallia pectoralis]|uniref:Uncharacterized protein n=1 Tax=Dallia pectoralis TaxID=75939 RepID=A0ACC2G0L9_DALPE|nr:hypothetical protein DPEC_G00224760 [Dallia pectoralis]